MVCVWLGVGGEFALGLLLANLAYYLTDPLPSVVRECLLFTCSAGIIGVQHEHNALA